MMGVMCSVDDEVLGTWLKFSLFWIMLWFFNGWYKLASLQFIALEKGEFMHQNQVRYA